MVAAQAVQQLSTLRPYSPRRPQESVLFQTISRHWDSFLSEITAQGQSVPRHVEKEFEAFLRCGIVQHGFVRLACKDCANGMLVGYSCKRRGFCPSCGGRRMNQTAMLLTQDVLPDNASYRQFVLTFPMALRYMMASRKKLMNQILKIAHKCLLEFYKDEALAHCVKEPEAGGITFIQLFGSGLNLAPHFHIVMFDGTFFRKSGGYDLKFRPALSISNDDVAKLMFIIAKRVDEHLKKQGITVGEMASDDEHNFEDAMLQTSGASIIRRIAFGKRRGSKVRTDGTPNPNWVGADPSVMTFKGRRCVAYRGFSLHANTTVEMGNRIGLEKLLKYVCRPALAFDRLSYVDPSDLDGDLKYALKSRWDDGSENIFLSPKELLEKLMAIIPPRYLNMQRYFGILGANHYLRSRVVKKRKRRCREGIDPNTKRYGKKSTKQDDDANAQEKQPNPQKKSAYWVPWDELLKRTFQVSPEKCVVCGGKMVAVDCVLKREAIEKILAHLKIDPHPPPRGIPYEANLQLVYEAAN